MARKREVLTPTTPLSPHYLAKQTLSKLKWSRRTGNILRDKFRYIKLLFAVVSCDVFITVALCLLTLFTGYDY